jgi:hypothetical protein
MFSPPLANAALRFGLEYFSLMCLGLAMQYLARINTQALSMAMAEMLLSFIGLDSSRVFHGSMDMVT